MPYRLWRQGCCTPARARGYPYGGLSDEGRSDVPRGKTCHEIL